MKKLMTIVAILLTTIAMNARTLVVYYSYTSNVHNIVNELTKQIEADVMRVEPAEKSGLCREQLCDRKRADCSYTQQSKRRVVIPGHRPGECECSRL